MVVHSPVPCGNLPCSIGPWTTRSCLATAYVWQLAFKVSTPVRGGSPQVAGGVSVEVLRVARDRGAVWGI